MNSLNSRFRQRVGFPENDIVTFEKLDVLLKKTAKKIPFENLCIINKATISPTKENLAHKILERNEGGLCYELNPLLYYFLIENGWNPSLIRGIVYDHNKQRWNSIGKTHVAILIHHNGQLYILDTGFGGNLPLNPIPLNGERITSANGEFRARKTPTQHGDYIFEMKLKHKDEDWKTGYAFDSRETVHDLEELNEIQQIIEQHEDSAFNKAPLLTRLTDRGNITLTESSFTEWREGNIQRQPITQTDYKTLLKKHFGMEGK